MTNSPSDLKRPRRFWNTTMSSVPAGQHSSGTPYGPRVNSIGSGTLWSLGVKTTVWRRTPSRIGTMTSARVKLGGGGCWAAQLWLRKAAPAVAATAAPIHRLLWRIFNRHPSGLKCLEHFANVAVHSDLRKYAHDAPVGVQDICRSHDPHFLDTVHVLFLPDAVSLEGFVRGVAGQREIELVFVTELGELFHGVGTYAEHACAKLFHFLMGVPKLGRLSGSTRRVRLGEKVKHQFLSPKILEGDIPARVRGQRKIGSGISWIQHRSLTPKCKIAVLPIETGEIPPGTTRARYEPSSFFKISWTSCGFALPPVAFITWPTNQPSRAALPPRYCSTCFGFAAMISRPTAAIFSGSLICSKPLPATISLAARPVENISARMSFPILPERVPLATSANNSASRSGETGDSAISFPASLSRWESSLKIQLAESFGSPARLTASSK